jgi:iron complex outermembrane receptor protein
MNKHTVFYCLLFTIVTTKTVFGDQTQIPDVIIKNHARHRSESGAMKQTLTRHQLAQTGAVNLVDALHATGGLQLHDPSGNGTSAALGMRGFGANASSNSLVLINGIPLSNPDLAPPDLNTLPLEDINRIDIVAGSEGVLYGDQAVGGLINIITDHTREKNLRFSCSAGSYDLRECHARYANLYRSLDYRVNVTSKATANYRQHNHYANNTVLGSASYN